MRLKLKRSLKMQSVIDFEIQSQKAK